MPSTTYLQQDSGWLTGGFVGWHGYTAAACGVAMVAGMTRKKKNKKKELHVLHVLHVLHGEFSCSHERLHSFLFAGKVFDDFLEKWLGVLFELQRVRPAQADGS